MRSLSTAHGIAPYALSVPHTAWRARSTIPMANTLRIGHTLSQYHTSHSELRSLSTGHRIASA
eukprot:3932886-Rhodomonas_salina.2